MLRLSGSATRLDVLEILAECRRTMVMLEGLHAKLGSTPDPDPDTAALRAQLTELRAQLAEQAR